MLFKIDRKGTVVSVTTLVNTGPRRWSFVFTIFSEYQGCHTDDLSVSVYGGLIIYILTLAALNVLLKSTKTLIFTISRKMFNAGVIRMLFDNNT